MLRASYQTYPQGRSRNVDSLRQRIQNLVDLQRAYANSLDVGPAAILDNDGDWRDGSAFGGSSQQNLTLSAELAQLLIASEPEEAETDPAINGNAKPRILVAKRLRNIRPSILARNLRVEELGLVRPALAAVRDCDGP